MVSEYLDTRYLDSENILWKPSSVKVGYGDKNVPVPLHQSFDDQDNAIFKES